jgi:hypothetical protein
VRESVRERERKRERESERERVHLDSKVAVSVGQIVDAHQRSANNQRVRKRIFVFALTGVEHQAGGTSG